ncbi:chemotaxis protein CheW [soil metagenome]
MNDTNQRTQTPMDLLVFDLGGARFGLDLTSVREVVRAVFITPLPDAPAVIEGIIDVRGEIVPVYDLRRRFGLPARAQNVDDHLVIAWGERVVSLRCERAQWFANIDAGQVTTGGVVARGGDRIVGVARLEDGLVLIQDLNAFLDDAERAELEDALAGREDRDAD